MSSFRIVFAIPTILRSKRRMKLMPTFSEICFKSTPMHRRFLNRADESLLPTAMLSFQAGSRRHLSCEICLIDQTPLIFLKGFRYGFPKMPRQARWLVRRTQKETDNHNNDGQVIQFSRKEVAVGSGPSEAVFDAVARVLQRKKGLKKWL